MEPWFDAATYSWIPGTLLGVIGGGIGGPLIGTFSPQGKHKGLVMSFHFGTIAVSLVLLIAAVIALATGQPYGVWYGLGLPGVVGVVVFGGLTPTVRKRYREAELRKSIASDL